jgi:hypothetical protein
MLEFLWSINYRVKRIGELILDLQELRGYQDLVERLELLSEWLMDRLSHFHKIFPWLFSLKRSQVLPGIKFTPAIPSQEEREKQLDNYEEEILLMLAHTNQLMQMSEGVIRELRAGFRLELRETPLEPWEAEEEDSDS